MHYWCIICFLLDRPFKTEFDTILTLYTSGNDEDLAASMKVCMVQIGVRCYGVS